MIKYYIHTLSYYIRTFVSELKQLIKDKDFNTIKTLTDYFSICFKMKLTLTEYMNYQFGSCSKFFRESFLSYNMAYHYWTILNPSKYALIARDKLIGHSILDELNIPNSKLLFVYSPKVSANDDMIMVHSKEQVVSKLNSLQIKRFIAKPAADSAHGRGVGLYQVQDFIEFGGRKMSIVDILDGDMILFEEVINQTNQLSALNESSVNTVRIMTALYPDNRVETIAAFLKIGRSGSCVDNAGTGGNVDCAINIETGELFNALQFNSWKDVHPIDCHPDSGHVLNGLVLDNWHDILQKVKSYQGQIPYLKTIGWDVALTDNGPIIVEINNWWDTTGQLFIGKGWHSEVKACFDAWAKYKGCKK